MGTKELIELKKTANFATNQIAFCHASYIPVPRWFEWKPHPKRPIDQDGASPPARSGIEAGVD
jgi:hypothetical protein